MKKQLSQGRIVKRSESLRTSVEAALEKGDIIEAEVQQSTRRCLRIPIVSVAHLTSQGFLIKTKVFVRDLSIDGMGGYTIVPYQKGERLLVELKIALSDHDMIQGALQGRIRWSTLVDNGKRFAFGLEFENREMERHQPCLYRYLKELEAMFYPI